MCILSPTADTYAQSVVETEGGIEFGKYVSFQKYVSQTFMN